MSDKYICQSCGMPIDPPELFGTEKDGITNTDYCKFCYANGAFTNSELTLEEMKEHIMEQMQKDKFPENIIERAIDRLPFLKRWCDNVTAV